MISSAHLVQQYTAVQDHVHSGSNGWRPHRPPGPGFIAPLGVHSRARWALLRGFPMFLELCPAQSPGSAAGVPRGAGEAGTGARPALEGGTGCGKQWREEVMNGPNSCLRNREKAEEYELGSHVNKKQARSSQSIAETVLCTCVKDWFHSCWANKAILLQLCRSSQWGLWRFASAFCSTVPLELSCSETWSWNPTSSELQETHLGTGDSAKWQ